MEKQLRTPKLVTGLVAVCALAISINVSAKNPKEVSFEIDNNKLDIKTNKTENDCSYIGSERGCIKVKKKEKSKIYFHLRGDLKCTLESGTNWKLNAVYLGGFNYSSKPNSNKFGFDDISDNNFEKVNADFNITDRTSGMVATVEKSERKIGINNENNSEYNVWYKVEAICEREDGKDAHITTFDPRIKNGGAG